MVMSTKIKDPFHHQVQEPFKVPEGYFEGVPERVMDRIHKEETTGRTRQAGFQIRRWQIWTGAAAAVLIIGWLGFSQLFLEPLQEKKYQQEIAWLVEIATYELNENIVVSYLSDINYDWKENQVNEEQEALLSDPEFMRNLTLESIIY